jgi:hypothetical protein
VSTVHLPALLGTKKSDKICLFSGSRRFTEKNISHHARLLPLQAPGRAEEELADLGFCEIFISPNMFYFLFLYDIGDNKSFL